MVLAGFIGLPAFAVQASAPPSSGFTTTAAASAGMRAAASRARYVTGLSGVSAAAAALTSHRHAAASTARAAGEFESRGMGPLQRYRQVPSTSIPGRFRCCLIGDSRLSSPSRHAYVACIVVAVLSCTGLAWAQAPSRPETLLKKITLDEKLGQLVQRAGGRSKALNSRPDDSELARVRAG